jgi:hypothetical protein
MDRRDRLIVALCALLRAERQTRAAFEAVVAAGSLSRETLSAILADPVPVITQDDLAQAERLARAA